MNNEQADSSKLFEAFCATVQNQYFFDERAYIFFNQNITEYCGIPRPSKWLGKNRFILSIISKYSCYIRFLWSYIFSYLLFTLQALICIVSSVTKNKLTRPACNTLALAVCSRSYEVISQAIPIPQDKLWLEFKSGDVSNRLISENELFINCLSVNRFRSILTTLLTAFQLHRSVRNLGDKNLILQTYTAFNWMLVLSTIHEIAPKKIITAEHHDRWAILIDYYCSIMRKKGNDIEFIVVQHGNEYSQTYTNTSAYIKYVNLPHRLSNVTELYVYDNQQQKLFLDHIVAIGNYQRDLPRINFYNFQIQLFDTGKQGFCILFVGHPVCEKLHIYLFKSLAQKGVHFFYKPHPTCTYAEKNNPGWIVIDGSSQFPKVNLLISYPSTLVNEYNKVNIKAFVHQLSVTPAQYSDVASLLHKKLKI